MKKICIAGSRHLTNTKQISEILFKHLWGKEKETIIINGGCPQGVDYIAASLARQKHMLIQFFDADWDEHGKAAGPIRNKEMAEVADELILIWDGRSLGSASMKNEALAKKLPIYEYVFDVFDSTPDRYKKTEYNVSKEDENQLSMF